MHRQNGASDLTSVPVLLDLLGHSIASYNDRNLLLYIHVLLLVPAVHYAIAWASRLAELRLT